MRAAAAFCLKKVACAYDRLYIRYITYSRVHRGTMASSQRIHCINAIGITLAMPLAFHCPNDHDFYFWRANFQSLDFQESLLKHIHNFLYAVSHLLRLYCKLHYQPCMWTSYSLGGCQMPKRWETLRMRVHSLDCKRRFICVGGQWRQWAMVRRMPANVGMCSCAETQKISQLMLHIEGAPVS